IGHGATILESELRNEPSSIPKFASKPKRVASKESSAISSASPAKVASSTAGFVGQDQLWKASNLKTNRLPSQPSSLFSEH
ncbi:hypothetical protein C2E31_24755, partial [Rhodopirellula baltica]